MESEYSTRHVVCYRNHVKAYLFIPFVIRNADDHCPSLKWEPSNAQMPRCEREKERSEEGVEVGALLADTVGK